MSVSKSSWPPQEETTAPIDFEAAVRLIPSGVVITDATLPDHRILYVNAAFARMTGYPADKLIGRNCGMLHGPDSDPAVIAAIEDAIANGAEITTELLLYRKSGEPFWNELRLTPRRDADGKVIGHIGILDDISARRALAHEAELRQTQLGAIIENMRGFVFQRILRRDGTLEFTHVGPSTVRALGLPHGQPSTIGKLWERIHPDDRGLVRDKLLMSAATVSPLTLEFRIRTDEDGDRWLRTFAKTRKNEAGDVIWDGVGVDVTDEKLVEERLTYLACHDPLTGLGNRMLFSASLGRAMAAAEAVGDRIVLLKLDLDSFSDVNGALGQQAGDLVLKELAHRIRAFSDARNGYAARMGGDEFAVFYATSGVSEDYGASADRLATALAVPIAVEGADVEIDASFGTAYFPFVPASPAPSSASELMRRASSALHEAKLAGRGLHRSFSSEALDRGGALLQRQALRRAIDGNELRLHYQPLVDIATGAIVGAEALVRWQHPGFGLLPPGKFIPLAETSGLMVALGNWVIEDAIRQVQAWEKAGLTVPVLSLNISPVQLREPLFCETMAGTFGRTGADPGKFEIELTEGVMIDASEPTLAKLNRLRAAGFGLAVDDFGAGHASFQYLRTFPISRIKIDQTFIRHMVVESSDASIIRAILQLARRLHLDVVAEGIETAAQRDFLRDEGCAIGQGFFYSKPLPPEAFARLLRTSAQLPARSRKRATAGAVAAPRLI